MKPIPNSKRSIKKRLEKELRKLFPDMAVFVRKEQGWLQGIYTYENWRVWIGKKFWSKKMCHMQGHLFDACDQKSLIEVLHDEQQRILSYSWEQ